MRNLMSQVFANTIDNNPIYAKRAEEDQNGVNIATYYAKLADLAAVAFSGSYNDLANTPSIPTKTSDLTNDSGFITASDIPAIPTKTSDLTNDSGFITASDIPAQVNADWNESDPSDPAYIENKPTIPAAQVNSDWNAASGVAQILNKPDMSLYALISSLSTVATSGSYLDLTDLPTISNVPSVTSSDDGKVLKASYSGGTGSYSWETAPSGLPASTSSDAGKLLGVDASGDPEWQAAPTFTQEQADWNESDTTDPSYIQNKPDFFIAQYGVTTYAQIFAAYEAGINVLCYRATGSKRSYMLGELGYAYIDNKYPIADRNFEFAYFKPKNRDNQASSSDQGIAEIETWNVYGDNHWTQASKRVAPFIAAGTGMTTSYDNTTRSLTVGVSSAIDSGAQAGSTAVQPGDLAAVATSGSYNDLSDKPTIPDAQVQSDWSQFDSTAVDYIKNKPADAPSDGKEYVRKNGSWVESSGAVETVLFDGGSNGANDCDIYRTDLILSQSTANFDRIKVLYRNNDGFAGSVEFDPTTTVQFNMSTIMPLVANGNTYVKAASVRTNDGGITWTCTGGPTQWRYKSSNGTNQAWIAADSNIYIHKVIGIKNGVNLYNVDKGETVLYSDTSSALEVNHSIPLSESFRNFERIRIVNGESGIYEFEAQNNTTIFYPRFAYFTASGNHEDVTMLLTEENTGGLYYTANTQIATSTSNAVTRTADVTSWTSRVMKVIGINRISS